MAGPALVRLVATFKGERRGLPLVSTATGLPARASQTLARVWRYHVHPNPSPIYRAIPPTLSGGAAYFPPAQRRTFATVDAFTTNVDIRLGISQGGTHALFFRVSDYNNWWRVRFIDTYFNKVHPVYLVVLERAVNGKVGVVGQTAYRRGSVRFTELRVRASGTSITAYTNVSATPFAWTSSKYLLGKTRHGFGRDIGPGGYPPELDRETGGFRFFDLHGLNLAPNAPVLEYPRTNFALDVERANQFRWRHSDDDAGDGQSAARLRYRYVGENSWTTIERSGPNGYLTLPAGTLTPGAYEWTAATRDTRGGWGPYAKSIFITTGDLPTDVVITSPVPGERIEDPVLTMTWATAQMDAYEVRVLGETTAGLPDATVAVQAAVQVVDADARAHTFRFTRNSQVLHLQVRTRLAGLWSPWASVRAVTGFRAPMRAQVALAVDVPPSAITVLPTAPPPRFGAPRVVSVNIYRAEDPDPGAGPVLLATQWPPNDPFSDFTVCSGVEYGYMVESVSETGSTSQSSWRFYNVTAEAGQQAGVVTSAVTSRV